MSLAKDIWRPAIVGAPIAQIVQRGSIDGMPITWLPPMPRFQFLADPFGLWQGGLLHVFVETYDYRERHGAIEWLAYTPALELVDRAPVLREPWHLSYPLVWEADGETWMLPEASRSGGLTLYRAGAFPRGWEAAARIALDVVPVDATPLFHDGRWWLFYADAADAMARLHVACAESLTGPWRPHRGNPVRVDRASARPGGTAVVIDGRPMLPVQDCTATYGGAIRPLWFDRLDEAAVEMRAGPPIVAPDAFAPLTKGLHTLSGVGAVTLIDVKRIDLSAAGIAMQVGRLFRPRYSFPLA